MPDDSLKQRFQRGIRRLQVEGDESGHLGKLESGVYVFAYPGRPGHVYCRIERGLETEVSECIPMVALDPYVRVSFVRRGANLIAVAMDALDATRYYGDSARAIGVAGLPPLNRGSLSGGTDAVIALQNGQYAFARVTLNATTDPGTGDDNDDGYVAGLSWWLNTATGVLWDCIADDAGAADWSARAGGAAAFTDLSDVPSSYSGLGDKYLRVKATEDGIEAVDAPTGGSGGAPDIILVDQKAQNTDGGTFTSGSWVTRDLNTEVRDANGNASLSSNQIALDAGTYYCEISAPANNVLRHMVKLRNVTDSTDLLTGTPENTGSGPQTRSLIVGVFTVGAGKALEVQHQCQSTQASSGFGIASNFAAEIYTVVKLWKLA